MRGLPEHPRLGGDRGGRRRGTLRPRAEWRTWPGYTKQERIAAEFAQRFASEHTGLRDDEDFWARCSEQFTDELLTDLALSCAMWLGMGRMLRTLDIGQSCKITL